MRKINPTHSEDWEYNFQNEKCDNCGKLFPSDECLVTTKYNGHEHFTLHFCGEHCANEFYLERLRKGGL